MSKDSPKHRFRWRKWNNIVHRDVGYVCVALTVIYAISGIAVNHIHHWNPNYKVERVSHRFEPVELGDRQTMVELLIERLELPPDPIDSFRSEPHLVDIFYKDFTVNANATAGVAIIERTGERKVLFDFNFLHLNMPKGLWTWVADLYAFLLLLLAITGMFVLKGPKGLGGRGKWWVGAGVVVPALFVLVLRYLP